MWTNAQEKIHTHMHYSKNSSCSVHTFTGRHWTCSPSLFSSKDAMTASSSMGFREHVEYTILPPSTSCSAPRVAIRSCKLRGGHTGHPKTEHSQTARAHITLITSFYDWLPIKHKMLQVKWTIPIKIGKTQTFWVKLEWTYKRCFM